MLDQSIPFRPLKLKPLGGCWGWVVVVVGRFGVRLGVGEGVGLRRHSPILNYHK